MSITPPNGATLDTLAGPGGCPVLEICVPLTAHIGFDSIGGLRYRVFNPAPELLASLRAALGPDSALLVGVMPPCRHEWERSLGGRCLTCSTCGQTELAADSQRLLREAAQTIELHQDCGAECDCYRRGLEAQRRPV